LTWQCSSVLECYNTVFQVRHSKLSLFGLPDPEDGSTTLLQNVSNCLPVSVPVAYPGIFSRGGGVQPIQLRTQGRENGDLRAVAPYSGILLNLQMSETRILIRLLRMYFPRNWEFGLFCNIPRAVNFHD
jgi:hypothetical protein